MIRVYFTPFDGSGNFGSEIEVTKDVDQSSIGKIRRYLDSTEYDVGILRYSNLKIKMRNASGRYSTPDYVSSIFNEKRSGSKVRVTWNIDDYNPQCGNALCGSIRLGDEVDLYNGILDDSNSKMRAGDQILNFDILSLESTISKVETPTISVSDLFSDAIYKILNQTAITDYLTVDSGNISCTVDKQFDDISWFSEKTGKESIEKLLLASNSILYVLGTTVYVAPRTPGSTVQKTFYGQASENGNEDILDLKDIRNGQNRIINFVRFKDTTDVSKNSDSISTYGVRLKELDIEFITNSTKRTDICSDIVTEFKDPKQEFLLETYLNYENYNLSFLDRVDVDYPTPYYNAGSAFPLVETAVVDDAATPLPYPVWEFEIDPTQINFKIMGIEIDPKTETIAFNLRGI